jgi:hypothetical protein
MISCASRAWFFFLGKLMSALRSKRATGTIIGKNPICATGRRPIEEARVLVMIYSERAMMGTSLGTRIKAYGRGQQWVAQKSYCCPACGETVDNSDLQAVRFHHHHVLHPRFDLYANLPALPRRLPANGGRSA